MGTPPLNTKLPDDKIKEIAEYTLSYKLQRQMHLQGFEVYEKSISDFISMVARLEEIMPEEMEDVSEQAETDTKTQKKSKKRKQRNKSTEADDCNEYYCTLHGHNNTHNTKDCKTLKRMREQDKTGNSNDKNKIRTRLKIRNPRSILRRK